MGGKNKNKKKEKKEICNDGIVLFGYWRSSSAWRIRMALNYKGINFENRPVNLLKMEHKGE